jgi:hypothetical protein
MSRQFFIQLKRHFFAAVSIGSGSQALRMGTAKYARRKGLASAGAGFREHLFYHPASLI